MLNWTEDFINDEDVAELYNDQTKLGEVKRMGGSWSCVYAGVQIAVRPDKQSAQACVSRYHEAKQRGEVG